MIQRQSPCVWGPLYMIAADDFATIYSKLQRKRKILRPAQVGEME